MFPDLWTSSNLLKITFNLWKQTEREKKFKNLQTGWDKCVERKLNKKGKKSQRSEAGRITMDSIKKKQNEGWSCWRHHRSALLLLWAPQTAKTKIDGVQNSHSDDKLAFRPEREREGGREARHKVQCEKDEEDKKIKETDCTCDMKTKKKYDTLKRWAVRFWQPDRRACSGPDYKTGDCKSDLVAGKSSGQSVGSLRQIYEIQGKKKGINRVRRAAQM